MAGPCLKNQTTIASSDAMGVCQRVIESLTFPACDDDEMRQETAIRYVEGKGLAGVWQTRRRVACFVKTGVLRMVLAGMEGLHSNIVRHMVSNFDPEVRK